MAVIKQQLYGHALTDVASALAESNTLMRESLGRPDFKEGVASYVEKRKPLFDPLG
jgi:enoyl-CoA hydratase/carnithine racemase